MAALKQHLCHHTYLQVHWMHCTTWPRTTSSSYARASRLEWDRTANKTAYIVACVIQEPICWSICSRVLVTNSQTLLAQPNVCLAKHHFLPKLLCKPPSSLYTKAQTLPLQDCVVTWHVHCTEFSTFTFANICQSPTDKDLTCKPYFLCCMTMWSTWVD